ncbi:unnamed protein product [Miscanthus lutarioriparius]|uniref:Uncharacterized protein n=1 Tax=Miscanthus lutarioriparius TaxID=422564 RepID=A0A811MIM5_9POAL|nr:unnamed protein product [Miscanthus lutarioriparius]
MAAGGGGWVGELSSLITEAWACSASRGLGAGGVRPMVGAGAVVEVAGEEAGAGAGGGSGSGAAGAPFEGAERAAIRQWPLQPRLVAPSWRRLKGLELFIRCGSA